MTVAATLEIRRALSLQRDGHAGRHLPLLLQGRATNGLKPARTLSSDAKRPVASDLHEALATYAECDPSVHGEAIEMWPLLVQMLRTFLEVDRAFHAWRRQAGKAAAGTRNGTGNESRNA